MRQAVVNATMVRRVIDGSVLLDCRVNSENFLCQVIWKDRNAINEKMFAQGGKVQ